MERCAECNAELPGHYGFCSSIPEAMRQEMQKLAALPPPPPPATFAQLKAEGCRLIDTHTALFRSWATAYLANMKAFEEKLQSSGLSKAEQRKIGMKLVSKADDMTNMDF